MKLYGLPPIKNIFKTVQKLKEIEDYNAIYYSTPTKNIYSDLVLNVMYPERTYPKWEKMEIKRKYGKYPTVYLDVYQPYLKSMFELLPKGEWVSHK